MKKMITIIALVMLMALVISMIGAFANRADAEPNEPSNKPTEPNEPAAPVKGDLIGYVTRDANSSPELVLGRGYFLGDTYFVAVENPMDPEFRVVPPDGLSVVDESGNFWTIVSGQDGPYLSNADFEDKVALYEVVGEDYSSELFYY